MLRLHRSITGACIGAGFALLGLAQSAEAAGRGAFEGRQWLLRSIAGQDVGGLSIDLSTRGPIAFGSNGCNRVSMPFKQDARTSQVTFNTASMTSTKMACSGRASEIEGMFASTLAMVRGYEVIGDTLHLKDAAGKVVLVYSAQPLNVVGVRWSAIGINNGRGGVESSAVTEAAWLRLDKGGRAEVHTGCVTLKVPYRLSGTNRVAFSTARASRQQACRAEGDVLRIHTALIKALGNSQVWSRNGQRLELRSTGGALQFSGKEG